MLKKRVILHVGLPKAGSTFLQRGVFPRLRDVYDLNTRDPEALDALIACFRAAEWRQDQARKIVDYLTARITEPILVISWEGFAGHPLNGFRANETYATRLKELFPAATVLLVVRRQDAFLESAYRQCLHNYHSQTVRGFLNLTGDGFGAAQPDRRAANVDVRAIDFLAMARRYAALFGQPSVSVLALEQLVKDREGFVARVLAATGTTLASDIDFARRENRGYSLISSRIAMVLNRFVHTRNNPWGIIPNQPFRRFLEPRAARSRFFHILFAISVRISLRYFLQNVVDRLIYIDARFIDRATRQRIMDLHRDSNAALDREFAVGLAPFGYY
ncbi:MAG: hypothetical protein H6907_02320 [Hyphomicrobiales bacterium]|nr:hypothetical protein [Hyphomicrobiales bacterium]MCP5370542.1 hypothetical protein [Hyphomicrobiales bacterium]